MKDIKDEGFFTEALETRDPEIFGAIRNELGRQRDEIELIASENIVSAAVLEAQGSVMTNKYAEGYPGKRYYGGCQYVDVAETLAIERAKQLFGCEFANVQPNSGSQMNQAVFLALLQPGDTFMGLDLNSGGHLTHGSPVNMSGKWFNVVSYGVRQQDELLDMEDVREKALAHKPKLIVAGGTAYSRVWDWAEFRKIADEVGAYLMVDMAHIAGLVAAGEHPSPVGSAQIVTSTTHKTLRGPRGGLILCDDDVRRDVDRAVFPNAQGGPMEHTIAAKAVAFQEAMTPEFVDYQRQIRANAVALSQTLEEGGLRLVAGGTDNHMFLVDLTPMNVTGRKAEEALGRANIVINRNAIPYDPKPPRVASGVRLGTPAITSRGMKEEDARQVGRLILQTLNNLGDEAVERQVKDEVIGMTTRFPIPGIDV